LVLGVVGPAETYSRISGQCSPGIPLSGCHPGWHPGYPYPWKFYDYPDIRMPSVDTIWIVTCYCQGAGDRVFHPFFLPCTINIIINIVTKFISIINITVKFNSITVLLRKLMVLACPYLHGLK
jgi:hypothetical protein